MDAATRLLRNTLYLGLANICSPAISMVLIIVISRHLGASGLGEYSASLAFVFFFEKFAQLGLNQLILRDAAIDRSHCTAYLNASTLIGLISSLAALPALYLSLRLMQYSQPVTEGVTILSLSVVFVVLSYYYQSMLEGLQRMERRCILSFVEVSIRVGLGVLFILLGYGVSGALAAVVASRIVTCLCALFIVLPFCRQYGFTIDIHLIRRWLKQSYTFLLISLVTTVFWRIDFVMLLKMRGPDDVGYYSAAYRLIEILTALTYSYIGALFPIMASTAGASLSSLQRQCQLSIKYLFIFTLPISVGTYILAPNIITLVYGNQFHESTQVLKILIWSICIFPPALVCARALVATKNQKYDLQANIFLITANIGANLALIPRYGSLGAAAATLLSVTVFLCIEGYCLSRLLVKVHWSHLLRKPFLAAIIMGIFTYAIREANLALVIFLSAAVYSIALLLLRTFSAEEAHRFHKILRGLSFAPSAAD